MLPYYEGGGAMHLQLSTFCSVFTLPSFSFLISTGSIQGIETHIQLDYMLI